jgi:glycosyltransferase involved in cell wall biosynthesis
MMNDLPLVSIITPSYNQADFLEATIGSVLKQEYPHIEYGVVDGGSTDASLEIIKRYEDHMDWWVSEPDRGQADAINKGMARTRGDIVAWINSDDIYLPGAIRKAVAVFERHDPALVFGDAITINSQGVPLNLLRFGSWDLTDLMRFRVICQPAVFIRRNVWKTVGGLDPSYHYMLDHQLWIRIAAAYNIMHVSELLAASRYHGEAKNVVFAADFSDEIERVEKWMRGYPALAKKYAEDRRKIRGGARRLRARYLLDGDLPKQAFLMYLRALRLWPSYVAAHWHRILYAFFRLITGLEVKPKRKSQSPIRKSQSAEWDDWPGLALSQERR